MNELLTKKFVTGALYQGSQRDSSPLHDLLAFLLHGGTLSPSFFFFFSFLIIRSHSTSLVSFCHRPATLVDLTCPLVPFCFGVSKTGPDPHRARLGSTGRGPRLTSAVVYAYSTVGCRRTGGRRSQPGSFLFFTTPANLVLILQSVFESCRLVCSAHTVCDDARRRSGVVSKSAMPPKKSSSQQMLFACGETVLNSFFQPGVVLLSSLAVLRQTVLQHPTVL